VGRNILSYSLLTTHHSVVNYGPLPTNPDDHRARSLRVLRAARSSASRTVAGHSTADADACSAARRRKRVHRAPSARDRYLCPALLAAPDEITGATPCTRASGSVAENARFAEISKSKNTTSSARGGAYPVMGDRDRSQAHRQAVGIPVLPGSEGG